MTPLMKEKLHRNDKQDVEYFWERKEIEIVIQKLLTSIYE